MQIVRTTLVTALALAAMAGCSRDRAAGSAQDTLLAAGSARDTSSHPAQPTTPAPRDTARPAANVVTPRGIGALRAGMTFAEANAALGGALVVPANEDTTTCGYLRWRGGPPGVLVMMDLHRIGRVDVDTSAIATAEGARVGDTESRILSLYEGRVEVTPHKYVEDGHYLTVTPADPADSAYRLVFETKDGRVTRYHAGRLPSVRYIEGCA
ncbi:MAG TPA: hypothetical protein VL328_17980 [Gemmatimonadaceae bacterium]|jgi:hypothetical protein|nr:hypothetical protein [Gemmatimonadaceae bacterium]